MTICKENMYIIKGTDEILENFFRLIMKNRLMKDIKIQKFVDKKCDILADLTNNQKKILNYAKKFGYYDYPRKITSEELSKKTGINKDEILENLRKAEKRIITQILEYHFI